MKRLFVLTAVPALLLAQAQFRKVDPQLTHERILAIVPMISGIGKAPARPMFSDLPGLLGFTAELSDDGKVALVEFVAKDSKVLSAITASGQRLERKDSPTKDNLLTEFKTYKRNFKPERFGLAIP